MCEPIMLAAAVAGAGLQAYGSYKQASAANKASEYNETILQQNAAIQETRAQDTERRGEIAETEERERTRRLIAQQESAFAGSGVDISGGSPLDVFADTELLGERDALDIRSNYAREAYGIRSGGVRMQQQAELSKSQRRNPLLSATTSFLGSAPSLISGFSSYNRNFKGTKAAAVPAQFEQYA